MPYTTLGKVFNGLHITYIMLMHTFLIFGNSLKIKIVNLEWNLGIKTIYNRILLELVNFQHACNLATLFDKKKQLDFFKLLCFCVWIYL